MSEVQTNFRAQDMLGVAKVTAKPVVKPARVAPVAAPAVKVAPIVEEVVEAELVVETIDAPAAE